MPPQEIPFGKVVTEVELRALFPADEYFGEPVRRTQSEQGIIWYEQPFKLGGDGSKVAYECGSCNQIVVGPLKLVPATRNTGKSLAILSVCESCNNLVGATAFPGA